MGSKWRFFRRGVLTLLVLTGLVGAVGAGVGGWGYWHYVIQNPGPDLQREHIRTIIAQESPVYFRDGVTRVGVFFEDEHRQFVPYEDLPLPYVMSIVAAEDARFWTHHGVDPVGIARAMTANLAAGGLVAGGSTLTQQTAKNLYYRPDRSVRSKGIELLNALRLEAHYDKSEILTFYVNQFHVSGNGRGLGIAARYFFSKEVEELSLVESAFLAGLVKGPSNYDPFIGDQARRERSLQRAQDRTRYVLGRLATVEPEALVGPPPRRGEDKGAWAQRVVAGREVQRQAAALLESGFSLPFKKGSFRYDSSAVLDEVARRLAEPPFAEVLAQAGIDDPATAGLKVVTTLDPYAQHEAEYSLAHHLSEVGVMLEGQGAAAWMIGGSKGPRFDPDRVPVAHELRAGRVLRHVDTPSRSLVVDLGGVECAVDRDALVRAAVATRRGERKDRYAKASSAYVDAFRDALAVDGVVRVSVREIGPQGNLCDLELQPALQGAVVVLRGGELHAMVGGSDNKNFNRATALRQMGSTWKPLVFHAAMKLGWGPADLLDNRRGVFPFSTTFYLPNPDHEPAEVVSMAWAGVNSENLASVWLLYHLTDHLSGEEVRALATSLDLARRPEEDLKAYQQRIQRAGVLPVPRRVEEAWYLKARHAVRGSLARPEDRRERLALDSLLFGWGFEAERRRNRDPRAQAALGESWLALQPRIGACETQARTLEAGVKGGYLPAATLISSLSYRRDERGLTLACGEVPEGFSAPDEALIAPYLAAAPAAARPEPRGRSLLDRILAAKEALVEGTPERPDYPELGEVWVNGRLRLSTLRAVDAEIQRTRLVRQAAGAEAPDLYDPDVLYWHQDFRVLLGLRYIQELAATYGVRSELQTVLSLPLGASEITLEESASLYQGITTGKSWSFPGVTGSGAEVSSPPATALLISEIRDVDDRVLYRATPTPTEQAPTPVAEMSADILRNVVLWGTGRRAKEAVLASGAPVPLGGKTGTTNDFRNAAFLGYAPVADGGGYRAEDGYVIGAYVGYDDNRSMSSGNLRLAGASGALPVWIGVAQGLQGGGMLGEPGGRRGGSWPLEVALDLDRLAVDPEVGLPLDPAPVEITDQQASILLSPSQGPGDLSFERAERPVRVSPRTVEALQKALRPGSLWDRPR
ncbi:MAG: transglycosylase domain-containing protein [Deltaproteobacteria bacterium]|nr:transglycosylase domain-containing protein [Deltaproteobacteria bacterium]